MEKSVSESFLKKGRKITEWDKWMDTFIEDVKEWGTLYTLKQQSLTERQLENYLLANLKLRKAYFKAMDLTESQVKFLKVFRKKLCNIKCYYSLKVYQ